MHMCIHNDGTVQTEVTPFLNMGGVRSRKYCASISDMTTTWGLRREVVLHINLPRAQGLCLQRGQFSSHHKSGNNSNSGTFELQQYHCRLLPYGEHIIVLEYQYILFSLNEGYHYQTQSIFREYWL